MRMKERFVQLEFENPGQEQMEILIAMLAEIGFSGFEETGQCLRASITETAFDRGLTLSVIPSGLKYTEEIIVQKNWNEEWEKSFEPVRVGRFCAIRAAFHPPVTDVEFEIIVTPKMSFGTGHHATTYLVIESMQQLPLKGSTVLDFGTGTGVLSILADKMGAETVIAIDNDEWSIENAKENLIANQCKSVTVEQVDSIDALPDFDFILANINKHVISANLENMKQHLKSDGVLILSGLLEEDEADIAGLAGAYRLKVIHIMKKNKWIAMHLCHASRF